MIEGKGRMIEGQGQIKEMGWLAMSALGLAQICSWGTLHYSFPQIAAAMEVDLGWLKSEIYGTLTIGIFTAAVFPAAFAAVAYLPASFVALIPIAIVYGAAKGIMTIVKGMAVPEFLTKSAYGTINGAMNLPINSLCIL